MQTAVFTIIILLSTLAFAEEESSNCEFGPREKMLSGQCHCTKQFKKIDVPKFLQIRKGHKLVAVCGVGGNRSDMEEHELSGRFLFETDAISEGVVDYSPGPAGDFFFLATKGVGGVLVSMGSAFKEGAKLKAPPDPNRKDANQSICARANAKLRVKKYSINYAGDSDATSRFITAYDVVSVGKYKFCKR